MDAPPPPPPPHGANTRQKASDLPNGQYDIFVIPPHSSGSGFLYLPSLQTHRNSFLAGVACTTVCFFIYFTVVPVIKDWFRDLFRGGGPGILVLIIGVGVGAWAWGKTQAENGQIPSFGAGGMPGAGAGAGSFPGAGPTPSPGAGAGAGPSAAGAGTAGPQPSGTAGATPRSSWQRPNASTTGGTKPAAGSTARSNWEKAREETRKKEEERRKAEEAKKKREEAEKERQKQREKDAKEREAREKKEAQERQAKENIPKRPPPPTARTEAEDDAYSFRPYDKPKRPVYKANSAASMYSESSYAASQTTARTTPPPSHRGPYSTKDPDKIIIKAVYSFNNTFMQRPIAQLISGQGNVTDGLILRITTEGLFIDDDVRGVPQREWDVKAWTMKLAEVWCPHLKATHFGSSAYSAWNPFPFHNRHQRIPSDAESEALLEKFALTCLFHCDPITQKEAEKLGRMPGTFPLSSSTQGSKETEATSSWAQKKGSHSPLTEEDDLQSLCPDDSASNLGTKSFSKIPAPSFPSQSGSFSSRSCSSASSSDTSTIKPVKHRSNGIKQSGEQCGLHVLRASIRDQEGKRYVFILEQTEGWKVAVGLQRLRRGTQVRALAVAGLPANETRHYLETLGWN